MAVSLGPFAWFPSSSALDILYTDPAVSLSGGRVQGSKSLVHIKILKKKGQIGTGVRAAMD